MFLEIHFLGTILAQNVYSFVQHAILYQMVLNISWRFCVKKFLQITTDIVTYGFNVDFWFIQMVGPPECSGSSFDLNPFQILL